MLFSMFKILVLAHAAAFSAAGSLPDDSSSSGEKNPAISESGSAPCAAGSLNLSSDTASAEDSVPKDFQHNENTEVFSQIPRPITVNLCFFLKIRSQKKSPASDNTLDSESEQTPNNAVSHIQRSALQTKAQLWSGNHLCVSGSGRSWKVESPLPIAEEGEVLITVEIPAMADVSIGLFDDTSRIVAAREEIETGSALTVAQIFPDKPLFPGTRYSIRIDGFTEEFPSGIDGSQFTASRISFLTEGEKPSVCSSGGSKKKAVKKKKGKNKKKRR